MSRAPSTPPLLDGYEYIGVLGTGGFADAQGQNEQGGAPRDRS